MKNHWFAEVYTPMFYGEGVRIYDYTVTVDHFTRKINISSFSKEKKNEFGQMIRKRRRWLRLRARTRFCHKTYTIR